VDTSKDNGQICHQLLAITHTAVSSVRDFPVDFQQTFPSGEFLIEFFILVTLYTLPFRWAGHVARMGQGRGVYKVLVGKPEGK